MNHLDTTVILRDLGVNTGLLSFLAVLYGVIQSKIHRSDENVRTYQERLFPGIHGVVFAVVGILAMQAPLHVAEGVIVDAKLVVAGLAGAYLPWRGAVLTGICLIAYRAGLGGIGAMPAILAISLTIAISIIWRQARSRFSQKLGSAWSDWPWRLAVGLSVTACAAISTLSLPGDMARSVLDKTWVAILVVYPVGILMFGFLLDSTERLRAKENDLLRTADQLRLALQQSQQAGTVFLNSKDTIAIMDPTGQILDVNPAFCNVMGYTREELIGKPSSLVRIDEGGEYAFLRRVIQEIQQDGRWRGEIVRKHKNGEAGVFDVTIEGVMDERGVIQRLVSIGKDMSEQKRLERELARVGNYDPLTGLPGRRLFTQFLNEALRRSGDDGKLLALCLFDIDNFREVNTHLGVASSDALLRAIGQRLNTAVNDDELVGRMGGDEFAVVLRHFESREQGIGRLEDLNRILAREVDINGNVVKVSCSGGVTFFPDDQSDADGLLRHADIAMYSAKEQGRSRIAIFDANAGRRSLARRESVRSIEKALHAGEMELFLQPKVRVADGRVMAAETLIRWRHPDRGLLAPGVFLHDIAGTPLANELDFWVLKEAYTLAERLARVGIEIQLSINVTVSTLIDPKLLLEVSNLQKEFDSLPRSFLEVELLESETSDDLSAVASSIKGLDLLGVRCAIDDFGTGYSSLKYLQQLPAKTVKVDQSFVRDMLTVESDRTLVRGIISLAKAFEREVVAEGVETIDHAIALCELGCDVLQGYGIARPMPMSQFVDWLPAWRHPDDLTPFLSVAR